MLLWAFAHLAMQPPAALMGLLLSAATLQLHTAPPWQLVAMLAALDKLRFAPGAAFAVALEARLESVGAQLEPHGLGVVLTAYQVTLVTRKGSSFNCHKYLGLSQTSSLWRDWCC